ncbi:hypothetical protein BDQ12DRAFT_671763 [Crucibulum laeve]|uniref:Uncharacterized protein n=1 Tax=Crucibulum laeve TaxID=68775 RepID=A0A5C3LFC2_9AGAR|nr:hypothetical protein BDQ12DRAFT_671763 [Crucibulum laeve]
MLFSGPGLKVQSTPYPVLPYVRYSSFVNSNVMFPILRQKLFMLFQKHVDMAIQLLSIILGCVFGIWAIKSYDASQQANRLSSQALEMAQVANNLSIESTEQSKIANQLALLAFCSSLDNTSLLQIFVSGPCSNFTESVVASLPSIAAALAPAPTITSNPSGAPPDANVPDTTPRHKLSVMPLIISCVVFFAFLGALWVLRTGAAMPSEIV